MGRQWHGVIRHARLKIKEHGIKVIISPRATLGGITLLQQGFDYAEVCEMTIYAGLSPQQIAQLALPPDAITKTKIIEAILPLADEAEMTRVMEDLV
jgi:hypothetical protein